MSFHTPERVDVEPPSVADSLGECAMTSPRVWQAAVDAIIDDVVEVVEVFFSELSDQLDGIFLCVYGDVMPDRELSWAYFVSSF
jgi:hypothetical protein